jgi:hypothetical protein
LSHEKVEFKAHAVPVKDSNLIVQTLAAFMQIAFFFDHSNLSPVPNSLLELISFYAKNPLFSENKNYGEGAKNNKREFNCLEMGWRRTLILNALRKHILY